MTDEAFLATIKVGDDIMYSPFMGGTVLVTVTNVSADINNGRAGFDGTTSGGIRTVWGYASQIIG